MSETSREYIKRINSVLDFVEKNLDVDLSLESLAEIAHYSPYHFHRIFLTVVNERINEYVTRKRIERIAAILLVEPTIVLKDLAFRYGFNSDNSFSRAFKKYYGISPTEFKIEGKKILSKIGIEPFSFEEYICSIDKVKKWIKMNAQILVKEVPEIRLASISHIGEFDKASDMFQRLLEWGHQKKVLLTSGFKAITIYHDNPNVTHSSKLRFSAAVTISKDINPDGEIRQIYLQKGIYAVGHFEVKTEEVAKAWKNMCIWVIENGYKFRDGDYFEMYHNDHQSHPEQKLILDICIPLERTSNVKLEKADNFISIVKKEQNKQGVQKLDYQQLLSYMKEVRTFFHQAYGAYFSLGKVYQGSPDFSYFSLTTESLKKQKLKFVIILDHRMMRFEICLSGQNKSIRKKYWRIFKGSTWEKYHLAESIDDSLSIIDQTIVEDPDFADKSFLMERIEKESLKFIDELTDILT